MNLKKNEQETWSISQYQVQLSLLSDIAFLNWDSLNEKLKSHYKAWQLQSPRKPLQKIVFYLVLKSP